MRKLDLENRFDAIVAWDSFFHLSQDEQRDVLVRFGRHLAPGGVLLTNAGNESGERIGVVEGEPIYHSSLDPVEYRILLEHAGFHEIEINATDPDCDGRTIIFAIQSAR